MVFLVSNLEFLVMCILFDEVLDVSFVVFVNDLKYLIVYIFYWIFGVVCEGLVVVFVGLFFYYLMLYK